MVRRIRKMEQPMSTSEEKIKIKDDKISHLEAEVAKLRGAIRGKSDAYQLLTNIANGIKSPADVQMAVSALRKIDEALK